MRVEKLIPDAEFHKHGLGHRSPFCLCKAGFHQQQSQSRNHRKQSGKGTFDLVNIKIGVVSRVKRDGMTLLTPLMTSSLRSAYDLVIMKTRLSESEWFY